MSLFRLITPLVLVFAALGCTAEMAPTDAERHPIGEADLVGSCAGASGGDFCGGPSDGNCWCDDACDFFGDCCSDKESVCDAATECPQTCGEYCAMAADCTLPDGCENPGCGCPVAVCDTECEAAGGSCFGGTVNCPAVEPGTEIADLDCGGDGPVQPQLTCCLPEPADCPQTCGAFCTMAADCTLPDGCENPGCGCPEKVCD